MTSWPSSFEIDGTLIGDGSPCYVIAEAGLAHYGSFDRAVELLHAAYESGANAFKTQHYDADKLVSKEEDPEWHARLKKRQLSDAQLRVLARKAEEIGITFLCTAHEASKLPLINELCPAFKIGSGEAGNEPLLRAIASYKKPVILSTGLHSSEQLEQDTETLRVGGASALALLHCVTAYPVDPFDANLHRLNEMRCEPFYPAPFGYSDHTRGSHIALAALACCWRPSIIEKHLCAPGPHPEDAQDWKCSLEPNQFKKFVSDIRDIEHAFSEWKGKPPAPWALKSIACARDLGQAHKLTEADLTLMRPGTGLPWSERGKILGLLTRQRMKSGQFIREKDVM